jgi:hypothetical protein
MRQSLIRVKTSCYSRLTGTSWVTSCHQNPSQLFGFLNHFVSESWKVTWTFWSELTTQICVLVYCVLINVFRDNALFCREWQMFNKFGHVTSVCVLRFILQLSIIRWTVCSLLILDKRVRHSSDIFQQGVENFYNESVECDCHASLLVLVWITLRTECRTRRCVFYGRNNFKRSFEMDSVIFVVQKWSFHGVNSASNRNEYQEYFVGNKGGRCVGLTTLPSSCANCLKIRELQPPGTLRACPGI